MLKLSFLHSLLLSVYPIVFLYSVNADQLKFKEVLLPSAISLGITSAILILLRIVLKSLEKAALITTAWLFLFFSYGAFHESFKSMFGFEASRTLIFPCLWIFVFLASTLALVKNKTNSVHITMFLNVVAIMLVAMTGFNIILQAVATPEINISTNTDAQPTPKSQKIASASPDIYYIILDGYARNDILQSIYDFDNSAFTTALTQKGFYIASQSCANYCQTYLSLASSLNFQYLDELKKNYANINSVEPLIKMIAANKTFAALKKRGYQTIAFSTGHSGTELKNADKFLGREMIGREFLNVLLNSTFLSALRTSVFDLTETQVQVHRNRVNEVFATLPELHGTIDKPVFVFAHVICPHPPFVFGANGERIEFEGTFNLLDGSHWKGNKNKYKTLYLNQLKYISAQALQAISRLMKKNKREKVIILQSDHGPGSGLDWQSADNTNLPERMSILNAYYFSDRDYSMLSPEISPVNTFRILQNKYFGSNLQQLPNHSYFSKWWGRYNFIDVTEQVQIKAE
ncbi:MAG: hypothetical protein Kow0029_31560 [Candidatus Rifleibacteriota bacterium]